MTHPDWPAFVSAIVAEPSDDIPRLVAADFLEENGDPDRGMFIRVQVELGRLAAAGLYGTPQAVELRRREHAFLGPKAVFRHLWAAEDCPELVRAAGGGRVHFEGAERLAWRRGFVDAVACPADEWLRHGAAVRARNPVRAVELDGCDRITRDAWYAGLPALRGLEHLVCDFAHVNDLEWLRGWLPGTAADWIPL
jgi:uncharacterized protein (TIGR02996 family)